jgi:hypothetical protein
VSQSIVRRKEVSYDRQRTTTPTNIGEAVIAGIAGIAHADPGPRIGAGTLLRASLERSETG